MVIGHVHEILLQRVLVVLSISARVVVAEVDLWQVIVLGSRGDDGGGFGVGFGVCSASEIEGG
jgi:hypothetical protein